MAAEADVEYVTVIRVLEYYGPKKWVTETLLKGSVPLQGVRPFGTAPDGTTTIIRSGLVQWEVEGQKVAPRQQAPYLPPPGGGN